MPKNKYIYVKAKQYVTNQNNIVLMQNNIYVSQTKYITKENNISQNNTTPSCRVYFPVSQSVSSI